ncbi:FHA domain-containing protein [Microbacterium paludicola]|uniref:FHA domain-containing protein n=1 Tax=Microbacterium paludicola TaxID=300019 RepID=UPI003878FBC5
MRVTYEPGGMLTIVADDGIAVLPGGLPQELIDDVWVGLDSGDGVAAVLDAMERAFGAATSTMPPFAVALLQSEAVRTAVRGDLRVAVQTLRGELELTGGDSDTWLVRLIEDALSVRVLPAQDPPAHASELPIGSGAVLAASVSAVFFEPAEADEPVRAQGDDARDALVPDDLVSGDPDDAAAAGPGEFAGEAPTETLLPDDTRLDAAAPEPEPVDEWPPAAHDTLDPSHSGPIEPLGDHDGATLSVEQFAALREREEESQSLGDHDGATIAVAPDAAPARQAAPVTADIPLDEIEEASAGLDPAPVPRFDVPALPPEPAPRRGRIRLSTGEIVELGRSVIVGRRPRSSRTTGADMPQLVAVESPQNDISRNHVEISSDGETVVVTDLHSTNGTVLYRTGLLGTSADPVRLHPGEQTVVVSGDVIDIGDGVRITFEELP